MRRIEDQEFRRFYDENSGCVFSDFEFRRCSFHSSALSITDVPSLRTTVRNVRLVDCEQESCTLFAAVVRDVQIDGLKTNGLFQTWGAVFQHVLVQGKIGELMISPLIDPEKPTSEAQRAFDQANEDFYSHVDWALDIRQAEFRECDIRGGIPSGLIRRDPETQVVVTRAKAISGEWRKLDLAHTHWGVSLENLLRSGDVDRVLVAPKRSKDFKMLLRGLQLLRKAGVAEPD